MTNMQSKAMTIIQRIPDEQMYYVIRLLESVQALTKDREQEKRDKAFAFWESMRQPVLSDFDDKQELAAWRDEKYGGHNSD